MANLENFKDVRTIASISALIAVGVSSSYFLNEISKIKEEQAEIKRHLASIIPLVNPDVAKSLNEAVNAIRLLDSRLSKAQDDIRILSQNVPGTEEKPTKRVYKRLTQRNGSSSTLEEPVVSSKPKFTSRTVLAPKKEETSEFDADVAAMME